MTYRCFPFLAVVVALPGGLLAETVFDTGEDMFAEDGPWIAVPAGFMAGPLTAADILAMADLDGDPLVITPAEQEMIAVLTQVLIAGSDPNMP